MSIKSDVVCISARDPLETRPTISNLSEIANQLIVARHPGVVLIDNLPVNTIQFQGSINGFVRIHEALKYVTTDNVFISGDDDFFIPSSSKRLNSVLQGCPGFSCVSAITLHVMRLDSTAAVLMPYLISPYVSRAYNPLKGEDHVSRHIEQYFTPLAIDFYGLYSTQRLRDVIELFVSKCDPETIAAIGTSGKVLQYLFSLSISLIGEVVPCFWPLYMRGMEPAVRRQERYNNNISRSSDFASFASEASQFLRDERALADFSKCLHSLYCSYVDQEMLASASCLLMEPDIKLLVIKAVSVTNQCTKIELLDFYQPKYIMEIYRSRSSLSQPLSVKRVQNNLVFTTSIDSLSSLPTVPTGFTKMLEPYLLDAEFIPDIYSACKALWGSHGF